MHHFLVAVWRAVHDSTDAVVLRRNEREIDGAKNPSWCVCVCEPGYSFVLAVTSWWPLLAKQASCTWPSLRPMRKHECNADWFL